MTLALSPNNVDIWQVHLSNWIAQKSDLVLLLNEPELQRANRFKFDIHRDRFIVARAMLRKIISQYTNIVPEEIKFAYGPKGKPHLLENGLDLQFNLSHSNEIAIYGIVQKAQIGIDVEKVEDKYNDAVAKRFFSQEEYFALSQVPAELRVKAFYQVWVKKEAVIKAIGEGLYAPLTDFSIHWDQTDEKIMLGDSAVYLHKFDVDLIYPAAVALLDPIKKIQHWEWKLADYRQIAPVR